MGLKKVAQWLAADICDPIQTKAQLDEYEIRFCEYHDIIPTHDEEPEMYYHGFWEPSEFDTVDKNGDVVGPFAIPNYHLGFIHFVERIIMESMLGGKRD